MTRLIPSIAFAVIGLVLGCAGEAAAQFDTPNRSFHTGTAFRLDGKHQSVACESCHLNGQYAGTPATCFDCHWVRRRDDRFQTRLGTQCEQCHRPTGWLPVRWDHTSQSGVGLNASHRQIGCESCHREANFRSSSVNCASCHQKEFSATTAPNHLAAGFPPTCDSCHRPGDATWRSSGGGAAFNHNSIFALVGRHAIQTCAACHRNNVFKGTPRDCAGCHQANYNATRNPPHAAAGFGTACETCHRPTDPQWAGGGFNHNAIFALVGAHATQACATCHKNNLFKGTPRDCVGCHQANYNATRNPPHAAAGFGTACETCHRPTDPQWTGASFNHNTVFALVGVHASQACATCHVNNVYRGTTRTCVGCHQAAYTATRNPNHVAAGFPTTCDSCHRATDPNWQRGTFTHNFPIAGPHNVPCAQCHTTPNNFQVFSCTVCHSRSQMDSHHRNRAGYVYNSSACYSCHPNGKH